MNDMLNTLPSLGQMARLIVFLILALMVIALLLAIVKALIPLTFTALVILGLLWLFDRLRD